MLQLAFELSGPVISVALFEAERLLASLKYQGSKQHAETLFPLLEEVLSLASKERSELDFISVSKGPGSFTGIRMGLAAAKVLAWALKIPLIAVSSLELIHEPHRALGGLRLALIDARGSRVYASLYRGEELVLKEDKYELSEVINCLQNLAEFSTVSSQGQALSAREKIIISGDGANKFAELAAEEFKLISLQADATAVSAENLGRLAWRMAERGEFMQAEEVEAHYCSLSQAERLRLEAERKAKQDA